MILLIQKLSLEVFCNAIEFDIFVVFARIYHQGYTCFLTGYLISYLVFASVRTFFNYGVFQSLSFIIFESSRREEFVKDDSGLDFNDGHSLFHSELLFSFATQYLIIFCIKNSCNSVSCNACECFSALKDKMLQLQSGEVQKNF